MSKREKFWSEKKYTYNEVVVYGIAIPMLVLGILLGLIAIGVIK